MREIPWKSTVYQFNSLHWFVVSITFLFSATRSCPILPSFRLGKRYLRRTQFPYGNHNNRTTKTTHFSNNDVKIFHFKPFMRHECNIWNILRFTHKSVKLWFMNYLRLSLSLFLSGQYKFIISIHPMSYGEYHVHFA